MPVTVLCPACDSDVSADKPTGAVQCPTCWARVPLDTAKRKPTDTPPPIPTARPASTPPRATRVAEPSRARATRSRRAVEPPKSGGAIWVVAAVVMVLVAVAGVAVFTAMQPPATATFNTTVVPTAPRSIKEPPQDEWVMVATPEGATFLAPGPLKKTSVTAGSESGTSHTAAEGSTTAGVFVFDLKNARRADREEFLAKLLGTSAERIALHGLKPIPGGDATEFTATDVTGFDHAGLVIGRGGRWFVFHISWKPEDDPKEKRRSAFVSRAGVTWLRPEVPADPPKQPKPVEPIKPKTPPVKPPKPR